MNLFSLIDLTDPKKKYIAVIFRTCTVFLRKNFSKILKAAKVKFYHYISYIKVRLSDLNIDLFSLIDLTD